MSPSELPTQQWRHKVFVYYVAFMILVFLLPLPTIPLAESKHVDKLVHFGIFLGFALLFYVDRQWRVGWTFLISVAFAGGIELVQWTLPYREGDWLDFIAGTVGAGLGAVFVLLIERQAGRVAARSARHGKPSGDEGV
jgi:VanZ family protein